MTRAHVDEALRDMVYTIGRYELRSSTLRDAQAAADAVTTHLDALTAERDALAARLDVLEGVARSVADNLLWQSEDYNEELEELLALLDTPRTEAT